MNKSGKIWRWPELVNSVAMARSLLLLLSVLTSLLSLTALNTVDSPADHPASSSCSDQWGQKSVACEVEEAKLRFARLGISM